MDREIIPQGQRDLTSEEKNTICSSKRNKHVKPNSIFRSHPEKVLAMAVDKDLPHNDAIDLLEARITNATGHVDRDLAIRLLVKGSEALPKESFVNAVESLDEFAKTMQVFAPEDEYEGQLIAQLIVLHENAMDFLNRASRTDRVDFTNVYLNGASKLLTRHHETLDMLLKYRRKGEQRVSVEHVHVYNGGKAIVGNIDSRGLSKKFEEGPHAKV
jgi:hypothetical protein